MIPEIKVVQHKSFAKDGEYSSSETPYLYWEVYIGKLQVKIFSPYDRFHSHLNNQEVNKRKMLKFVRDLEEELCVTAYWCQSVKKVVETDIEESMDPVI